MGKLNKKEADLYMLFRREVLNLRDELVTLQQKDEFSYKVVDPLICQWAVDIPEKIFKLLSK